MEAKTIEKCKKQQSGEGAPPSAIKLKTSTNSHRVHFENHQIKDREHNIDYNDHKSARMH